MTMPTAVPMNTHTIIATITITTILTLTQTTNPQPHTCPSGDPHCHGAHHPGCSSNPNSMVAIHQITSSRLLGRDLDDNIWVYHRASQLNDGSQPNAGIHKATPNAYWHGPVVACAVKKIGGYRDINLTDFRHLADWLEMMADDAGTGMLSLV